MTVHYLEIVSPEPKMEISWLVTPGFTNLGFSAGQFKLFDNPSASAFYAQSCVSAAISLCERPSMERFYCSWLAVHRYQS